MTKIAKAFLFSTENEKQYFQRKQTPNETGQ